MTFICTGAEAEISLEMDLRSHYQGRLYHREIDLVEVLPPPVSERHMQEFTRLLLIEGRNIGSSRPASPSQLADGVVSPVCLLVLASSTLPVGVCVEKGIAFIRKRCSLHVVPSLVEETESDDVGLHPHKVHKTVTMTKLLGGIRNVLGDRFSVPG